MSKGLFNQRVDEWWKRWRFYVYLSGLLVLLLLGFLWDRMVITVPAGSHGVRYRPFHEGTVTDKIWGEGTYFIPPWDSLTVYETRLQERSLTFSPLTKDGLQITLAVSIRYYPLTTNLGYLHKDIGPDYFKRLIQPSVEAYLRRVVGDRRAEEVYASEGSFLQESANLTLTVKNAMVPYVRIDAVLVREIQLPEVVRRAINEKHQQEQLVLAYNFRIQTEEKEAERKRIEASGIRDFNTIAKDIKPEILRWRGIDATLALASSANAKVVIVGSGKDGLPLILDTTSPAGAAEPGARPGAPDPAASPTGPAPRPPALPAPATPAPAPPAGGAAPGAAGTPAAKAPGPAAGPPPP